MCAQQATNSIVITISHTGYGQQDSGLPRSAQRAKASFCSASLHQISARGLQCCAARSFSEKQFAVIFEAIYTICNAEYSRGLPTRSGKKGEVCYLLNSSNCLIALPLTNSLQQGLFKNMAVIYQKTLSRVSRRNFLISLRLSRYPPLIKPCPL